MFRLVLAGPCLPDLDGFQLCRRLRHRAPHTPILFFSGAAEEVNTERGIDAGANAYVIKPDVGGLFEGIAQFVLYAESDGA